MMLQNADDSPGPQFCQLDSAQEKVVVGRSAKLGEEEHGWRIEARGDVPAAAVAKVSRRHCLVLRTERTEAAPLGWALKNISERNHITLFQQGKEQTLAPRTGPEGTAEVSDRLLWGGPGTALGRTWDNPGTARGQTCDCPGTVLGWPWNSLGPALGWPGWA